LLPFYVLLVGVAELRDPAREVQPNEGNRRFRRGGLAGLASCGVTVADGFLANRFLIPESRFVF
jgi:hypothetical protein